MFSVLSRLARPSDGRKADAPAPMSTSLQKKFSRGVDYNMKILIKGDRNVGKSCLLQRLQGGNFIEEYLPTDQISVAPIHWKYKDTEHIIKVEVWEVVDKGKARKKTTPGLKFDNSTSSSATETIETPALDATFLDVYVNSNGVIMMMDITKAWTFEYVKREIDNIPSDLPVIILGNHCDMHHHREVDLYQIEVFISNTRQKRTGPLRYAESSMRNGFGLRLLHKFFNIPFLKLQRQTLLNQLAVNDQELSDAYRELDDFEKSEGGDYNSFLDRMASKRKQDNNVDMASIPKIATDKSPSIVLGAGKPIIPPNVNPLARTNFAQNQTKRNSEIPQTSKCVSPKKTIDAKNGVQNRHSTDDSSAQPKQKSTSVIKGHAFSKSKENLDDFCAGVLDNNFLDDHSSVNENNVVTNVPNDAFNNRQSVESDSDGDVGVNPLVAGIQDDLDSMDEDGDDNEIDIKLDVNKINLKLTGNVSDIPSVKYENVNIQNQFTREMPKFHPFNESIMNRSQSSYVDTSKFVSSLYNTTDVHTYANEDPDDPYDDSPDFNQPPGYDSMPSWSLDTSIRRSPEGGEGVSPVNEPKKEKKVKEDKKHKKSKKSKDVEKSSKKEKDKEKPKDKEKKLKEKKHKKRGSDEYLEEFLNGKLSKADASNSTYEAI